VAQFADSSPRPHPTKGEGEYAAPPSRPRIGTWTRRWPQTPLALACATLTLFIACLAAIAANYPTLTGRIVDQANVIAPETRSALETKLSDLEARSGIQLVVATVSSLGGEEIEPYANGLFRTWKLGEKTKNNGVLFLVAPNEHRVRIEVGYGLEGTLTDALSKIIVANAIAPRFKAGDFSGGIARGVDDIITVLTTDASEWQQRPQLRLDSQEAPDWVGWVLLAGAFALLTLLIVSPGFRFVFFNVVLNSLLTSGSSRGYSGGGSFGGRGGGGFSGGGGSSGGGGASGSW
jgi:uncharacterized protein